MVGKRFKSLFESAHIGSLELKNRILMAPMGTRLASEMGAVTQRQIDYYEERAKGGVGAIIVEVTSVDYPLGSGTLKNLTIDDNNYIAGHNELVEAIQTHGAKAICQIWHVGRNARPENRRGLQPVAPSAIPTKFYNVMPRELTTGEVEEIVKKFVQAAIRVKAAGYDGVELHGAQGYLIGSFMSPSSNRRGDRYGGHLLGRMTFPLEIVQGIRGEVGRDYPLLFRFAADEFIDGGMNLEESKKVAKILEEAGVDALDIAAGTYDSIAVGVDAMSSPQGWKIYLAESIKKVVKIPVISVGPIRTPEFAEQIISEGKIDFVSLGRGLLADPYWPQKAREGREKEIIPCISCNDGCVGGRVFRNLGLRCAVNPLTGRERMKESLVPVKETKKVFVIGGGPAGMMAALTAKARGHHVLLYEKGDQLGGQLRLGARIKEKISWFQDYLLNQMKQQKIDVRLGRPISGKTIIQDNPDAVIVATGAIPLIPDIPGIKSGSVCTAWEVLEGKKKIKEKVVLVAGGGSVGCETALSLTSTNKKVI
ncbi:MAG: FAD-dependent oxidoreductase, partial [Desulfobacteraceae bacterium]|nr:FAD-dependent oxidoreductase [Desulfobacteraceae bacterium]